MVTLLAPAFQSLRCPRLFVLGLPEPEGGDRVLLCRIYHFLDNHILYMFISSDVIMQNNPMILCRSDSFRNFVDSCLQKIPQDRPTSDVLLNVRTESLCNMSKHTHTEPPAESRRPHPSFSSCSTGSCAASVR